MPRSAPGLRTAWPSSLTSPLVGVSSPATMRSSVLLPHPDGPRIVMKSLSVTAIDVGSSACVGGPPCTPANVRETLSIASALNLVPHTMAHGKSARLACLNERSEISPMIPIRMMPKMICPVLSSAWLSVIMWPMPLDAPISSATIT